MPPRTSTKPKLLDQVRLAIRARRYTILFLYRHVLNKDVSTTMIYTHVLNRGGHGVFSPADRL
ncbi:MAG: hypothetical protein HY776_00450 [Actinobacteria bacterium]|nr:hypothetical protein [Actinomycetota bacterium]